MAMIARRLALGAAAATSLFNERVQALSAAAKSKAVPPVAPRRPKDILFGKVAGEDRGPNPMDPPIVRQDPYFWLRDDTRKDKDILAHLDAENAYSQAQTAHLEQFRESLYQEMLSHVKEDDDTVPYKDGDYMYWSRTVKGLSYRQYLRKRVGSDEDVIYLDVNEVSKTLPNPKQCVVNQVEASPDGSKVAYAVDGTGYETYDIVVKYLDGSTPDETITKTMGGVAWKDETTFYYVVEDKSHRPYQVWRHVLGEAQDKDVLVYEELDELYNVACWRSLDGSLIFIEAESKETTELRFIPQSGTEPILVRKREPGVRYDAASHAPTQSLILTSNIGGLRNRALFTAPVSAPADWTPLMDSEGAAVLPHDEGRSLDNPRAFKDFVVVTGREDGFHADLGRAAYGVRRPGVFRARRGASAPYDIRGRRVHGSLRRERGVRPAATAARHVFLDRRARLDDAVRRHQQNL